MLRTEPVFEIFRNPNPREECYDERVVTREPDGGDPTGGTVLGATLILGLVAFAASRPTRDWQRIGVRILGSWAAASALLVLALRLAR